MKAGLFVLSIGWVMSCIVLDIANAQTTCKVEELRCGQCTASCPPPPGTHAKCVKGQWDDVTDTCLSTATCECVK